MAHDQLQQCLNNLTCIFVYKNELFITSRDNHWKSLNKLSCEKWNTNFVSHYLHWYFLSVSQYLCNNWIVISSCYLSTVVIKYSEVPWASYILAITTWMMAANIIRHFSEGFLELFKCMTCVLHIPDWNKEVTRVLLLLILTHRYLFHWFLKRVGGREDEERNISVNETHRLVASHTHPTRPTRARIEPVALCFEGRCSNHWASLPRASNIFKIVLNIYLFFF